MAGLRQLFKRQQLYQNKKKCKEGLHLLKLFAVGCWTMSFNSNWKKVMCFNSQQPKVWTTYICLNERRTLGQLIPLPKKYVSKYFYGLQKVKRDDGHSFGSKRRCDCSRCWATITTTNVFSLWSYIYFDLCSFKYVFQKITK